MILDDKNKPLNSKLLLVGAVIVWFCLSIFPSSAQIREDTKETSEKLDALKKQIEAATEKTAALEKQTANVREEIADIQQELINSAADIQNTEENII